MSLIDEAAIERRAMAVLQRGDRGRFTAPSPSSTEHLAKPSMLAALAWMYMDMERAVVELEALIARQDAEGQILGAAGGGAALPLLASLLRMIYHAARSRKSPLEGRLAALIPAVDRHHRWLAEHSDRQLYQPTLADERAIEPATSGEAAAWGEIGINALRVQAESDLADISIHANLATRGMIARRVHVAQALAERRWRSDLSLFAPAATEAEISAEGALPLWAGAALRSQAAALVERHLIVGGQLWAAYPLRASAPSARDAQSPSTDDGGRLCPLASWLLVRGLYRYGFAEQARAVNEALLERVAAEGCWESFSATTGEGRGEPESVITAALALDLAKTPYHYYRW